MAVPYESTGRTRQKQRTRDALLEAAQALLAAGETPTVEQAADAAGISRTTAYRYFASQRSLLLAALPRAEFRNALEVGCSTGALAADLAPRCHDLVVVDASPHAVATAQARLGRLDGVHVRRAAVPLEWPAATAGGFDLIVVSEVGYFLSPRDLDGLVTRVRTSLAPEGVVALCHWRHEVVGWPLDGPAVQTTTSPPWASRSRSASSSA